ncbi:MAG: AbrB/MazE/SpoVT family DNA-binding domain-containing protein [Candidatus Bathyarchaeota archaeon]|nr:AbrB/MazE/SpoVT family DNA-binding domain-containing protein [Candidatus Bathyarchaeota archaeon]
MKEILVTRKGQVTIPVEYRKKYKIDEGARLLIEDTADGLLIRPIQKMEEQAGTDAGKYDVKELKMSLDRVREEWR